jgi:hypothetical protein
LQLRALCLANGGPIEAALIATLKERGLTDEAARTAAQRCDRAILRNAAISGAVFTVLVGLSSKNLAAAGLAGGSAGVIAGISTLLLDGKACPEFNSHDLLMAIDSLNRGDQ